jgi:hypothetical protein
MIYSVGKNAFYMVGWHLFEYIEISQVTRPDELISCKTIT